MQFFIDILFSSEPSSTTLAYKTEAEERTTKEEETWENVTIQKTLALRRQIFIQFSGGPRLLSRFSARRRVLPCRPELYKDDTVSSEYY